MPSSPGIAGPSQQGLHVPAMQGVTDGPLVDWFNRGILAVEGDGHSRLRKLVNRVSRRGGWTRCGPRCASSSTPVWSTGSPTPVGSSSWPSFADRYPIRVVCGLFGLPDSDAEQDGDAIIEHCRARLADFKVPQYVTGSTQPLPRNAGGKLLKAHLRQQVTWGQPLR